MALQLALAVQQEITARLDEIDHLRRRQVERSQYEADSARHRYMQVDPAHRLVADSLEVDWNVKLRASLKPRRTTSAGAPLICRRAGAAAHPSPRHRLPRRVA